MSKADKDKPSRKPGTPAAGQTGAGDEFAMHEHIGRHLKVMFDEVASEPLPARLLELLEKLERKQTDKAAVPVPPTKPSK